MKYKKQPRSQTDPPLRGPRSDTDRTKSEDSVVTPSQSWSPSILKNPISEDVEDQESALADSEDQVVSTETEGGSGAEPLTAKAPPATLSTEDPLEETKPRVEPGQPAETIELSAHTNRASVNIPGSSVGSQRIEPSSKSGKPPIPPKFSNVPDHQNTPASGERSLALRHLISTSETASTNLRSTKSGISSKPAWMKSRRE